jgi:hypothetical protein
MILSIVDYNYLVYPDDKVCFHLVEHFHFLVDFAIVHLFVAVAVDYLNYLAADFLLMMTKVVDH